MQSQHFTFLPFDAMHAHLREIGFKEFPCNRAPLRTGAAYPDDGIEKVLQYDIVHCPVESPKARHPNYVLNGCIEGPDSLRISLTTSNTAYLHTCLASSTSSPDFELRVLGRAQSLWIRVECIKKF